MARHEYDGRRPAVADREPFDDEISGIFEDQAIDGPPCTVLMLLEQLFELARAATGLAEALDHAQHAIQPAAAIDDRGSRSGHASCAADDDRLIGKPVHALDDERRIVGKDRIDAGGETNDAARRRTLRRLAKLLQRRDFHHDRRTFARGSRSGRGNCQIERDRNGASVRRHPPVTRHTSS
jgi:hypothetical protein